MSVNIHSFAPLLVRRKEPPMHNRHCRLLIDTMKSLSPAARTLKPLTLSCLGVPLVRHLAVAIHISPNNGPMKMIPSAKLVVDVLKIHCTL
jgi:hypothetical protein